MPVSRWIGLLPALAILCGCALQQAEVADRGRDELVGLSQDEVRMCAGQPANVSKTRTGEIWMYEHGATNPPDISLVQLVPLGSAVSQAGANGYCRVQMRFVRGAVAEVAYAGATDLFAARDAVCAPIINTCLRRKEAALARQ